MTALMLTVQSPTTYIYLSIDGSVAHINILFLNTHTTITIKGGEKAVEALDLGL